MAYTVEWFKNYIKKNPEGNKYKAKGRNYNGNWYDSTLEMNYAQQLDWKIESGDILKWERQVKLELKVNDNRVCNYFIDFKEYHVGGDIVYTEVKGFETPLWKLKWKITEALWPNIPCVEDHATLKIVK